MRWNPRDYWVVPGGLRILGAGPRAASTGPVRRAKAVRSAARSSSRARGSPSFFALALFVLVSVSCLPRAAHAEPCTGDAEISIGEGDYVPEMVCIRSGASVHWTNDASDPTSIVELVGRFDSGSLESGVIFSLTLGQPGTYRYGAPASQDREGQIVVALEGIDGPADEPIADHIPEIAFPPGTEDDLSPHPIWNFLTSRTRILLSFEASATVAEANAALAAAGVVVVGGLPRVDTLLVLAEDTPDFSALEAALEVFRNDPAVAFATMSAEVALNAIPRPIDTATTNALANPPPPPVTTESPITWVWEIPPTQANEPLGADGNWNLESTRVPQAWNWRETR